MTTTDGERSQDAAAGADEEGRDRAPASARQEGSARVQGESSSGYPGAAGAGAAEAEEVAELIWKLDFGVSKSLRYHAARRRWFENLHYAAQGAAVVSAVAAFLAVYGVQAESAARAAVFLATLTFVDLILGFYRRADVHTRLYQRFSALAAEMAVRDMPTREDYGRWSAERLRIEGDEPPPLSTLNVLCHNLEAQARDLPAREQYLLSPLDRLVAPLGSFRANYERLG